MGRVGVVIEIGQRESDNRLVGLTRNEETTLLWPRFRHDVWIEGVMGDEVNGCMPFEVRVTVAGHTKKVVADPTCED